MIMNACNIGLDVVAKQLSFDKILLLIRTLANAEDTFTRKWKEKQVF